MADAEIKSLEYPTLKVPFEILSKKFKHNQRQLQNGKEVNNLLSAIESLDDILETNEYLAVNYIKNLLSYFGEIVSEYKSKAEEIYKEEIAASNDIKNRLEHLKEYNSPYESTIFVWKRKRVDRMLVEYFLSMGYYDSALLLAKNADVHDLTNIHAFINCKDIENDLRKHSVNLCLKWCDDNKNKLNIINSNITNELRIQQFIELVRIDQHTEAVAFAREYFSTFSTNYAEKIQHCMTLLICTPNTKLSPYKELFDLSRWDYLINLFRKENYRLFNIPSQNIFTCVLQSGLSALKTPQCYSTDDSDYRNKNCPVCYDFNQLAIPLMYQNISRSYLKCSVTGEEINENNPAIMFPSGYVYGRNSLAQSLCDDDSGRIVCKKSKIIFEPEEIEKVYIM